MHLSSFGLISLDGSVAKPEPGLNFARYQIAMAHYSAAMALRARLKNRAEQTLEPSGTAAPVASAAPAVLATPYTAGHPVAPNPIPLASLSTHGKTAPAHTSPAAALVGDHRR